MATIEFGIDLGTTNSAVAHRKGAGAYLLKNTQTHSDLTPSAVYVHRSGKVFVGQRALNRQAEAPQDVATEFKRLMGRPEPIGFPNAAKSLRIEELSAEVLKSLQADVQKTLGRPIEAAVITVPAAFQVPQRHATHDAAKLAGIGRAILLQEPIAAAIGYGFHTEDKNALWLTFDLGGGTLDIALVEIKDGTMEVRSHMGNNHLGGKDCDWAIVDEILIPHLSRAFNISGFARSDERWEPLAWRLKKVAEDAKIALSTSESYLLTCDEKYLGQDNDGNGMDLDLELTRRDYEPLVEPLFARAINLCQELLKEQRVAASEIQRVILVGGPTMTPLLREMLEETLGLPCEKGVDPMSVVALGAAIYGGTQIATAEDSARRAVKTSAEGTAHTAVAKLTYKPIQRELDAPVNIEITECPAAAFLEIEREDGEWSTGRVPLGEGRVGISVLLVPHSTSTFQLRLWSSQGAAIPVQPDAFEITHGITVGAPPLPHSLGVGLENGQVKRVIEKDARLPARGTRHDLTLAKTVEAGSRSCAVFPICEGESDHSGRNIAIGWFKIRGSKLARTLFAGTNLNVTFEADEDAKLRVTVNADLLSEPIVAEYNARYPKLDREERQRQKHRLAHAGATFSRLKGAAAELGEPSPELEAISQDHMLEQVETSLNACGDKRTTPGSISTDELVKAHNLLCEVEEMQYRLEQRLEVPRLKAEACWIINAARVIAETKGTTQDQQYVTSVVEQLETAMKHEDWSEARRQMTQLEQKRHDLLRDDLDYLKGILAWFATNLGKLKDPVSAQDILNEANDAVNTVNVEGVQMAIGQLVTLLPPEQSESGIALPSWLR